jgi:hypothetical protein
MAADAAGREFQTGVTNLRSADIAARDVAAGRLGDQRIAGAGTGLAALPGVADVAQVGFGAELAPYSMLSQILGGPTTLSESQSTQFSTAEDFARAFAESFGSSYGEQSSSSKSKAFKLGFE